MTVSLDLADPFVVSRYRDAFLDWIPGHVDLLFGNQDEFGLLCGVDRREDGADERMLAQAAAWAPVIVMKAGARGAYLVEGGESVLVSGVKVKAQDTTGAGDAFAAGYLFASLTGKKPSASARLGNRLAASIVAVEGCNYDRLRFQDVAEGSD